MDLCGDISLKGANVDFGETFLKSSLIVFH